MNRAQDGILNESRSSVGFSVARSLREMQDASGQAGVNRNLVILLKMIVLPMYTHGGAHWHLATLPFSRRLPAIECETPRSPPGLRAASPTGGVGRSACSGAPSAADSFQAQMPPLD